MNNKWEVFAILHARVIHLEKNRLIGWNYKTNTLFVYVFLRTVQRG